MMRLNHALIGTGAAISHEHRIANYNTFRSLVLFDEHPFMLTQITMAVDSGTSASPGAATAAAPQPCPYQKEHALQSFDSSLGSIDVCPYAGEAQIQQIIALVAPQLSEPYSIFTYRFFLNGWPDLCFLVRDMTTSG